MKLFASLFFLFFAVNIANAQVKESIYNPEANAASDLKNALIKAKTENKQVLLQVGGNWCKWCIRFNKFCSETSAVDSMLKANYVLLHINYSKENKNLSLLKQLEFPQRFGFPVLLVLDASGKRLHTQDSGFLESGEGYDKEKVLTFLKQWTVDSLKPEKYLETNK
ncbi:MAG: thioredoxin family protein [Bacteroidota bacterium]